MSDDSTRLNVSMIAKQFEQFTLSEEPKKCLTRDSLKSHSGKPPPLPPKLTANDLYSEENNAQILSPPPLPERPERVEQKCEQKDVLERGRTPNNQQGFLDFIDAYKLTPSEQFYIKPKGAYNPLGSIVATLYGQHLTVLTGSAVERINVESSFVEGRFYYGGTAASSAAYDLKICAIEMVVFGQHACIVVGSQDGHLLVLNEPKDEGFKGMGQLRITAKRLYAHSKSQIVGILPFGQDMVCSVSANGLLVFWESSELKKAGEMTVEVEVVKDVQLIKNTNLAALIGQTTLLIVDLSQQRILTLSNSTSSFLRVTGTVYNDLIYLFSLHDDGKIGEWRMSRQKSPYLIKIWNTCRPYKPTCLEILNDTWLLIGNSNGRISMLRLRLEEHSNSWPVLIDWQAEHVISNSVLSIKQMIIAKDDNSFTAIYEDGSAHVWSADLQKYKAHFEFWKSLIPDGFESCPIRIKLCSWNVDSQSPPPENDAFWRCWLGFDALPDLIVVGLQEIVPLESKTQNASTSTE